MIIWPICLVRYARALVRVANLYSSDLQCVLSFHYADWSGDVGMCVETRAVALPQFFDGPSSRQKANL